MKNKKASDKENDVAAKKGDSANVAENQLNSEENRNEAEVSADTKESETDHLATIAELNDKLLRLYSEFDNFRKRTIREKIEMSRTASEQVITELLPVIDDLERGLKSFESTDNVDALKEGVQLIFTKFKNILALKGLQEIKTLGEPFNTDQQEAIAHIPAPSDDLKNKVVDELQKGYLLNDKVIRFAKVVVGS